MTMGNHGFNGTGRAGAAVEAVKASILAVDADGDPVSVLGVPGDA